MAVIQTYTVPFGGERLDRIAKRLYGSEQRGAVEVLLGANQGLGAYIGLVPENTVIAVPEFEAQDATNIIRPWD